jgi:hypothetical protein
VQQFELSCQPDFLAGAERLEGWSGVLGVAAHGAFVVCFYLFICFRLSSVSPVAVSSRVIRIDTSQSGLAHVK